MLGPHAVFVRCTSGNGWLPLSTPDGGQQILKHIGKESEVDLASFEMTDGKSKLETKKKVEWYKRSSKDSSVANSGTTTPRGGNTTPRSGNTTPRGEKPALPKTARTTASELAAAQVAVQALTEQLKQSEQLLASNKEAVQKAVTGLAAELAAELAAAAEELKGSERTVESLTAQLKQIELEALQQEALKQLESSNSELANQLQRTVALEAMSPEEQAAALAAMLPEAREEALAAMSLEVQLDEDHSEDSC